MFRKIKTNDNYVQKLLSTVEGYVNGEPSKNMSTVKECFDDIKLQDYDYTHYNKTSNDRGQYTIQEWIFKIYINIINSDNIELTFEDYIDIINSENIQELKMKKIKRALEVFQYMCYLLANIKSYDRDGNETIYGTNKLNTEGEGNPLMIAIKYGDINSIKYLIERKQKKPDEKEIYYARGSNEDKSLLYINSKCRIDGKVCSFSTFAFTYYLMINAKNKKEKRKYKAILYYFLNILDIEEQIEIDIYSKVFKQLIVNSVINETPDEERKFPTLKILESFGFNINKMYAPITNDKTLNEETEAGLIQRESLLNYLLRNGTEIIEGDNLIILIDLLSVEYILDNNKIINYPLCYLAKNNDIEAIKRLLKKIQEEGPEYLTEFINRPDNQGNTPLYYAITYNNVEIIKLLIENGVNLDVINMYGNTPFHYLKTWAAFEALFTEQEIEQIETILIKLGNYKVTKENKILNIVRSVCSIGILENKITGLTAEEISIFNSFYEKIDIIKKQNIKGELPIHIYSQFKIGVTGSNETGYINNDIDQESIAEFKKNMFSLAAVNGTINNRRGETEKTKKIPTPTINKFKGYTPLIYAIIDENSESIEMLLENGADPKKEDYFGYPPLLYAFMNNDKEIIDLLIANGAVTDYDKWLDMAKENEDKETIKFLKKEEEEEEEEEKVKEINDMSKLGTTFRTDYFKEIGVYNDSEEQSSKKVPTIVIPKINNINGIPQTSRLLESDKNSFDKDDKKQINVAQTARVGTGKKMFKKGKFKVMCSKVKNDSDEDVDIFNTPIGKHYNKLIPQTTRVYSDNILTENEDTIIKKEEEINNDMSKLGTKFKTDYFRSKNIYNGTDEKSSKKNPPTKINNGNGIPQTARIHSGNKTPSKNKIDEKSNITDFSQTIRPTYNKETNNIKKFEKTKNLNLETIQKLTPTKLPTKLPTKSPLKLPNLNENQEPQSKTGNKTKANQNLPEPTIYQLIMKKNRRIQLEHLNESENERQTSNDLLSKQTLASLEKAGIPLRINKTPTPSSLLGKK